MEFKQCIYHEGVPGDFIHKVADETLKECLKYGCDGFIKFNGIIVHVENTDDVETIADKYYKECHKVSLKQAEDAGLIDWKTMSKDLEKYYLEKY